MILPSQSNVEVIAEIFHGVGERNGEIIKTDNDIGAFPIIDLNSTPLKVRFH